MADILEEMSDELNDAMASPDPKARLEELRQFQRDQEERDAIRREKEAEERRKKDPYYWKGLYEREVRRALAQAQHRKETFLKASFVVSIVALIFLISWIT